MASWIDYPIDSTAAVAFKSEQYHATRVGFAQPEPESLIQMKFRTAESQASNLLHGGFACDENNFELASVQHSAWPAGRLWRISAPTWFDRALDASTCSTKDAAVFAADPLRVVEFLSGILSGMEHLEDLNEGSHPLTNDPVVAQAWDQSGFAHYSSVSRTLDVCQSQTVKAVEQAIWDFSRPFIATQIDELLRCGTAIIYDLDLMGQAVSPTSTTYPEARFGWMDDSVQLGYPHLTVGQVSIGAGLRDRPGP